MDFPSKNSGQASRFDGGDDAVRTANGAGMSAIAEANSTDQGSSLAAAGGTSLQRSVPPAELLPTRSGHGDGDAVAASMATAAHADPAPVFPGGFDASMPMHPAHCPSCGFPFFVPASFYFRRLSEGRRIGCPGCSASFRLPNAEAAAGDVARWNVVLVEELEALRIQLRKTKPFCRATSVVAGQGGGGVADRCRQPLPAADGSSETSCSK